MRGRSPGRPRAAAPRGGGPGNSFRTWVESWEGSWTAASGRDRSLWQCRRLSVSIKPNHDGPRQANRRDNRKVPTRTEALEELTAPNGEFALEETVLGGVPMRIYRNAPAALRAFLLATKGFGDKPF